MYTNVVENSYDQKYEQEMFSPAVVNQKLVDIYAVDSSQIESL